MWFISHNHVVILPGRYYNYPVIQMKKLRQRCYVQGQTSVIIEPEFKYRQSYSGDTREKVMKVPPRFDI